MDNIGTFYNGYSMIKTLDLDMSTLSENLKIEGKPFSCTIGEP